MFQTPLSSVQIIENNTYIKYQYNNKPIGSYTSHYTIFGYKTHRCPRCIIIQIHIANDATRAPLRAIVGRQLLDNCCATVAQLSANVRATHSARSPTLTVRRPHTDTHQTSLNRIEPCHTRIENNFSNYEKKIEIQKIFFFILIT